LGTIGPSSASTAACAACLALARWKPDVIALSVAEKAIALFGLIVAVALALMKIIPIVPGHFTLYEWLALAVWCVLGAVAALTR